MSSDVKPGWWVSWYCASPSSEFELHSPWWVSGYDADDRTIYCAAVRAADEAAAYDLIRGSYDNPPSRFDERFCEPLTGSPFTSRWPKAGWMAWEDDGTTCACGGCASRGGHGEGER